MTIRVLINKFSKRHWPEKWWVLSHPFIASRVWKLTQHTQDVTAKVENDISLDGDINGGQVDAFRHAFWMAMITRHFSSKTAKHLGKVHEKANRIDFKKRRHEDGALPDKTSSDMDLKNNEMGIRIALRNPACSENELADLIKQAILKGDLWILKKNMDGNYLDWQGHILFPDDFKGKWYNKRCLVPSDYKHEV